MVCALLVVSYTVEESAKTIAYRTELRKTRL